MRNYLLLFALMCSAFMYSQLSANKIYTDYNTFWESGLTPATLPDNTHNLLAFRVGSTVFSTGVNDQLLSQRNIVFTAGDYSALPTATTVNAGASLIGVGLMYGGNGNVTPVPVTQPFTRYLSDGTKGLDLGTAIFNFPASGEISYNVTGINPNSIGDGVPDLIITQMGAIANTPDRYFFRDSSGERVGNVYSVNLSSVSVIANFRWKFYDANTNPPTYNSQINGGANTRDVRVLTLDWADLGITPENVDQIAQFVQIFSGQSDSSFTAYNRNSLTFLMAISGIVYNDSNGGTPDGIPYQNASVSLKNNSGTTVINTTVTNSGGNYVFNNVPTGNYTVELTVPTNYEVVGNSDGTTSNILSANVTSTTVIDRNFGIYRLPCVRAGASGTPDSYGNVGILTKANQSIPDWPENVPNAHLVLDSSNKGLVVTHMTSNQRNALTAVDGMLIYNTDLECVQLYRGTTPGIDARRTGWNCITRTCNQE